MKKYRFTVDNIEKNSYISKRKNSKKHNAMRKNVLILKEVYDADHHKVLTPDNCIEYNSIQELAALLKDLTYSPEYINVFRNVEKHNLPALLTTTVEYGLLKGQEGYHNYLFLDIDEGATREEVEKKLSEYAFVSYYSWSHGIKEGERFRLVIPLDRSYTADEVRLVKVFLRSEFPWADPNSWKRNTLMYAPVMYEGYRDPVISYNDGKPYSLESFLTLAREYEEKKDDYRTSIVSSFDYSLDMFDEDKQRARLHEVLSWYPGSGHGVTHDWLFRAMVALKRAGFSDSDIINILEPYETREHKGKVRRDLSHSPILKNISPSPYFLKRKYHNKKEHIEKVVRTGTDVEDKVYKVKRYLSEIQDIILEAIEKHSRVLIKADTNIGKTYTFLHLPTDKNILLLVPTRNLVQQLAALMKKEKQMDWTVLYEGKKFVPSKIVISTYDGLKKIISSQKGLSWLYEAIMVVDEAHNITMASNYSYRQSVMRLIHNIPVEKKVYLTATPFDNITTRGFYKIEVQKEQRREKNLYSVVYKKNRIKAVLDIISRFNGKHVIFLNNKKELQKIQLILENEGYKVQLVTSDTVEEYTDLIENGKWSQGVDILLTTSVLGEGFRFSEDVVGLHILSPVNAKAIHQISERPKQKAIENTFVYINDKKELFSEDFLSFSTQQLAVDMYTRAEQYIELATEKFSTDLAIKRALATLQGIKEWQKEKLVSNASKATMEFMQDMVENIRNYIYYDELEEAWKINEVGIAYEISKLETSFQWRNIMLLINELLNYNFINKGVIEIDNDLDKERKKVVKDAKNEVLERERASLAAALEDVYDDLDKNGDINELRVEADTYYALAVSRLFSLRGVVTLDRETEVEVITTIGVSGRKFHEFLKRIRYSIVEIPLRDVFNSKQEWTADEINTVINEWRKEKLGLTDKLKKTKTTQIFTSLFHVETRTDTTIKKRIYSIKSDEAWRNTMDIDIPLEAIIRSAYSSELIAA